MPRRHAGWSEPQEISSMRKVIVFEWMSLDGVVEESA
jgi:hypothetical protein